MGKGKGKDNSIGKGQYHGALMDAANGRRFKVGADGLLYQASSSQACRVNRTMRRHPEWFAPPGAGSGSEPSAP